MKGFALVGKERIVEFTPLTTGEEWYGNVDQTEFGLSGTIHQYPDFAKGTQELPISIGHKNYRNLSNSSPDVGGPLLVIRREYSESSSPVTLNRVVDGYGGLAYTYKGKYHAALMAIGDADFPEPRIVSNTELDAIGTSVIAGVAPTSPLNGLMVTLGELRSEGIPSLVGAQTWKDRTLNARNAGSEYLNVQFGWLPLVNEIRGLARTVIDSDEIRQRYEAESGKAIKRAIALPVELSSETTVDSSGNQKYPFPPIKTGYWAETGALTTTHIRKSEQWFEATFTYHLPPVGTLARDLAIANKLYGTRLTPEVVWNLTPWSWAVDWFSNTGNVIANVGLFANDGLVMSRGYMMSRQTDTYIYSHDGAVTTLGSQPISVSQSLTTTVKQRRKATPFGFGVDLSGLTDRQWSILVALGLSRGSNGMKYE
jgi:hypothetical protein